MIKLPDLNCRRWRAQLRISELLGKWAWSFELVGAKGAVHLHVSGPHHYDNQDHWSTGLEYHSREPSEDRPPDHAPCWLLEAPCWHDGTSLYPQERYLPLWHEGNYAAIFRKMIADADSYFYPQEDSDA